MTRTLLPLLILAPLLGCGDEGKQRHPVEPTDTGTAPAQAPGAIDAWTDDLVTGTITGFDPSGGSSVAASWDGASWQWQALGEPGLLSLTEGPVRAAASTSDGVWLVLDGTFLLHDGVLREVPWAGAIDGEIRGLAAVGERLWIRTDRALQTRYAGRLSSILLDGAAPTGPIAPGRTADGAQVLWVADGSLVVAMDPATGEVLEGEDLGGRVTDLSVDGTGRVHALVDGRIEVYQGGAWGPIHALLDAEDRALGLWAEPTGAGTWIQTETGWLHHEGAAVDRVQGVPAVEAPGIDGLGRLVHADADGLHRIAARRPVDVLGIAPEQKLVAPEVVTLVPTAPETLTGLQAALVRGDERLELAIDADSRATLDPLGRVFGRWTLELQATHGGEVSITNFPLRMRAAGGATWSEHIQPIYVDRCARCHDDGTETVLRDPDDWEPIIDLILEKVISGEMPLVGTRLESSEIALIQAWAEGGFPP